ncbi:unnamed protein product [Durusdinium trenchii]|uniref:LicD/FKTN/FKRP nucleotidyltransferase domain-containing protein n=1 Tax=Durusdinium trenchii TaxID=1381693 RepID=A0ABP0P9S6_9DINO
MTPYVLFVLALYAASLWQAASFSLLGCPSDPSVRAASQSRMKALLLDLLATATSTRAPGEKKHDMLEQEHLKLLEQLVNEHTGTAGVVHEPSRATGYATTGLPLPCVPGIVATEFLQLLWVWKKQGDASEAGAVIQQSDRHFAFLRISPWINILNLGYGLTFAAGQALCHLVPSPPEKIDFDRAARRYHLAWPGSTTTEATTFKQYHVLTGFDYRDCALRFLGRRGPAVCSSRPTGARPTGVANAWPHREFATLAMRQPWACGVLCHFAVAFAQLAEAYVQHTVHKHSKRIKPKLSQDQVRLIKAAQTEILLSEAIFEAEDMTHPEQVQVTCSLVRAFPIFFLLSKLSGVDTQFSQIGSLEVQKDDSVSRIPNQPPPPTLAKLCDRLDSGVPSQMSQRLTVAGSHLIYGLLHAVGSLLDFFGVKWWMSSGALLGTLRNGGLLPQDCDVDIALWRPDSHHLVSPSFKAALAAAGILAYHMPIYFQYRFCMVQVPAAADVRSVQGGLACHLPYIDAHLADVAFNGNEASWHYIHRTDLQYAQSFPLKGILKRERMRFGELEVWIPKKEFAERYLSQVYGDDWRTALRDRRGHLIANLTMDDFHGFIARPTGPLRDILQEHFGHLVWPPTYY